MSLASRLSSLWRNLVHRDRVERELDDELGAAFDLLVDEKTRAGLRPDEARRAATLELGQRDAIKEQVRDVRSGARIETVLQDVRYAARLLRRDPLFTMIAALSLALGIGANGAVFSLADALLLRPLPVPDPAAVVTLSGATPKDERGAISYANYGDLRKQTHAFDGLLAYQLSRFSFARSRDVARETRMGMLVSDNFFDVLGVQPALGRNFTREEGRVPGRDAVVVLDYDFWKDVLAADHSILNAVVRINEIDFHVIGIAGRGFSGTEPPLQPAFYVPAMMAHRLNGAPDNPLDERGAHTFSVKGRLKSGVSREQAQAELTALWKRLEQAYPVESRNRAITVLSQLEERVRQEDGTAVVLATLSALAAVVLLIACANVGSLLLGRARARSPEMAIRLALGVSRSRLLQQLLIESLMLALVGYALGLVFAYGAIRFFQTIQLPTDLPLVIAPRLDRRVLLVTLIAGVSSALLFGVAPAWQSVKTHLVAALKSAAPSDAGRQRAIGRNALVVAQVALSMVLLIATGMLLDGFRKLLVMDPGFRTDHLLMASLDTSIAKYTPEQTRTFYRRLVDRLRALPGVVSVTLTSSIPLDPPFSMKTAIPEGHQFPAGQDTISVFAAVVDEHYMSTMKAAMARGRAFTADDTNESHRVTIVNEEFAKRYWPSQDPLTRRLRLDDRNGPWLDVVGVVKTGKYLFVGEPPEPFLYLPFAQQEQPAMSVIVETTHRDAAPLAGPLRNVVRTIDESQPVFNVRTFSSFYAQRAIGVPLLILRIVGTMGLLGLILALIGLYGVVAYSVARRTREIGLRMAIGADQSDVLKMVLRQGLMLSVLGIVAGGIASVFVARLLTAGLIGLGAPNPQTYIIVPALLIALTLIASYFPARRASLVDPLRALRYE
jgi:macrolide transport system ATP-binding/permease protein